MSEETTLLVPFESYEENAVNIGTQQKSADMARFIDTVREDGLYHNMPLINFMVIYTEHND